MMWISSESVFEYFHIAMMALHPISFFGKRLKAFFEYFYTAHVTGTHDGYGDCQIDDIFAADISFIMFFAFNCSFTLFGIIYHLVQLNFLHFMSIFSDFWNFSHLLFKKYFAIISCLLVFGIMIYVWPWSQCDMCCVKVLKKCFQPLTKKGNGM